MNDLFEFLGKRNQCEQYVHPDNAVFETSSRNRAVWSPCRRREC